MTHDRDIERLLDAWFADGPSHVADRVIDGAADRIARHRQLPAWRLQSWRSPTMSTPIKLAAIGTALLVVLLGGAVFLGGGGPGPAPTPSPTASPSPTPSSGPTETPSAVFPTWYTEQSNGAGILAAGSQTTRQFDPGFTFTVPEGWVNSGEEVSLYSLFPDTTANEAEFAASGGLAQEIGVFWHGSPYWICDAWEDHRGTTAAEIVASIVANEAIATSDPVDVTIGGLNGKQVDIRLDPGWTETCPGDPPTFDLGDTRTRAILLDTPDRGPTIINVGSRHSADHEAFLAVAMPIVESFQFDVAP